MGFAEELHPRDGHGKFASGAGGGLGSDGAKKGRAEEASKDAGRESTKTGGEAAKHSKAADKHKLAADKLITAAKEARSRGEASSDPATRSQHMAEFSQQMRRATVHMHKESEERSKATAASGALSAFVAKHTAEPKAATPKAPKAPKVVTAPAPTVTKSGLGAFVAKHTEKPAAEDDHRTMLDAMYHVDKAGRHSGLVPIPELRDHLEAKGWNRERLDKALLSAQSAYKVDLKTANDPTRSPRAKDGLEVDAPGRSVIDRELNEHLAQRGLPPAERKETKYYVVSREDHKPSPPVESKVTPKEKAPPVSKTGLNAFVEKHSVEKKEAPAKAAAPPVAAPAAVGKIEVGKQVKGLQNHANLPPAALADVMHPIASSPGTMKFLEKAPLSNLSFHSELVHGSLGVYEPGEKRLYVSTYAEAGVTHGLPWEPGKTGAVSSAAPTAQGSVQATFVHELGHHIHTHDMGEESHYKVDDVIDHAFSTATPSSFISQYSRTNKEEYFAENFAAYHLHKEDLKSHAPAAYNMVETVLKLRGIQ